MSRAGSFGKWGESSSSCQSPVVSPQCQRGSQGTESIENPVEFNVKTEERIEDFTTEDTEGIFAPESLKVCAKLYTCWILRSVRVFRMTLICAIAPCSIEKQVLRLRLALSAPDSTQDDNIVYSGHGVTVKVACRSAVESGPTQMSKSDGSCTHPLVAVLQ